MIVKENINFERGQENPKKKLDIGRESSYSREKLFQKLNWAIKEIGIKKSKIGCMVTKLVFILENKYR